MTTLVLTLNDEAAAQLSSHTRVRVKIQKRGGVDYVGLRPSYRVSGKNSMVRTNAHDDGTVTIEIPPDIIETEQLPELKSQGRYQMVDIGYCWFILKEATGTKEDDPAIITVSKRKGKKAASHAAQTVVTPEDGAAPEASADPQDPVAQADQQEDAAENAQPEQTDNDAPENTDATDTAEPTNTDENAGDTAQPADAQPEASGDAQPEVVEKQIKTPGSKKAKKLVDAA